MLLGANMQMLGTSNPQGGGYGIFTVSSKDGVGKVIYNDSTYKPPINGGAYPIIVPDGGVLSIDINAGYGYNLYKNGIEQNPVQSQITIESGDSYLLEVYFCLSPDTLILMADGTSKQIKDVVAGDVVRGPLGDDIVVEASSGVGDRMDVWKFDDGSEVKTVGRHRFYNVELGEPMYLEAWNIGEHALKPDGSKAALVSHERLEGEFEHCTLFTEKHNLYYANGMLAGNRRSDGYEGL